jgi:hypothetical protein
MWGEGDLMTKARRRGLLRGSLVLAFLLVTLVVGATAFASANSGPTISTDKGDYTPGATVHLAGADWAPQEAIHVIVNDSAGDSWKYATDVAADDDGTFATSFQLPDWFVATYTATATGPSGTATTTFTDANVTVNTNTGSTNVSLTWAKFNGNTTCTGSSNDSGSQNINQTTTFAKGVDSGQSIQLTVPATVGALNFSSWSGASTATTVTTCIAGSASNQTTTANYAAAPVDTAPNVTGTTPSDGATDVLLGSNITISFSESVNATTSSFTLECPTGTTKTFTIGSSPASSFTLDPAADLPYSTTCTVTVVAANVTDADSNDPPDNMASNYVFSFTTEAAPNSDPVVSTAAADADGTEGDTLSTSGTFTDPDNDTLTLTADNTVGTFTDNGDGTWSWSYPTNDDVASNTITVTADDANGGTATDTFEYSAVNADPVVQTPNDDQSNCGVSISASFTDAGTADTHTATIDWGDGNTTNGTVTESNGSGTVTGSHTYAGPGNYTVKVTVTDDDNGSDTSDGLVVNNAPHLTYPEPPIIEGKTFKIGSAIPVKIVVTGCTAGLAPTIKVQEDGGSAAAPNAKGKSSKVAGQMRYDASLPGFIYNWDTKGLSKGYYTISIDGLPTSLSPTLNYAVVELVKG